MAGNTGRASIVFQFQPKYNQRLITKKELASKSPFFTPRVVISLAFCAIGVLVALLAFSLYSGGYAFAQVPLQDQSSIPDFVENVNVVQGTVVRITETHLERLEPNNFKNSQ